MLQLVPFQTPTSSQIKAAAAAMCIEFRPFLRVSCSYQGSDKLISQALTSTGLPTVFVVEWEVKKVRSLVDWIFLKATVVAKYNSVVFRSVKQAKRPWHSWWGVRNKNVSFAWRVPERKWCLWSVYNRYQWKHTTPPQHPCSHGCFYEPTIRLSAWLHWVLWANCLELGRPDDGESTKI